MTLSSSAGNLLLVVCKGLPLVGQDQPRLAQRVTAEHATDGVGDQLAHGVGQQQCLQLVLAFVVAVAVVRVAGQGDFIEVNLFIQLILQTVDVNKDAVVFLLQPLHLQSHLPPVGAELQRRLKIVRIQKRQTGEIPGCFIGIPVRQKSTIET
jgi:hypothetical protein